MMAGDWGINLVCPFSWDWCESFGFFLCGYLKRSAVDSLHTLITATESASLPSTVRVIETTTLLEPITFHCALPVPDLRTCLQESNDRVDDLNELTAHIGEHMT